MGDARLIVFAIIAVLFAALACAPKGQRDEPLAMRRSAAEREAGVEKQVITPGPLAPAGEQLTERIPVQ